MRLAALVLTAFLTAAAPASADAPARAGDAVVLQLDRAGKRALRGVTVRPVAPATSGRPGLRLPAKTVAVRGGVATVELSGALRFRSGRRGATATALRLTASATSSALSAKLGRSRVTLFAARGRPTLGASSVALTGARAALAPAAATRLKRALRLKRAPSARAVGRLTLTAGAVTPPAAPAPVVITPAAAAPAPTATPAPPPAAPRCADRFAATPAGSTDWFACDLPGQNDLKSWTDYIQGPWPSACDLGGGSVTASGGAQRVVPAAAYDHRFPADAERHPDGSATIRLQGTVAYRLPAHGIEESIGAFVIEVAADGRSGQVFADGRSNDGGGMTCDSTPAAYADEHVLDLDFSGVAPVTSGGVTRWIHVPATTVAGEKWIGGSPRYAGRPWGSFTIALPAT
jgi:hypothetical protein